MKKQQGFTLIELIVVIVILGILAVTAAPKFIDVQKDARGGTLDGMLAAIQGANTMVYGKSAINGTEGTGVSSVTVNGETVATVYGYVAATKEALEDVLEIDTGDWTIFTTTGGDGAVVYPAAKAADNAPANEAAVTGSSSCSIFYKAAAEGALPTYTVDKTGC